MQAFRKHHGIVIPLCKDNVDTDAIIPKQFLKRVERTGFAEYLFHDWRYKEDGQKNEDFVLNRSPYTEGTVLLAGSNFGCGSSREHAPWALRDYGIRAIIAPSFADIFYNNCLKNGVLPIVLPKETTQRLMERIESVSGYSLTVDLEETCLYDQQGTIAAFPIDAFRRNMLLQGLDDIGLTLQREKEIREYEGKHQPFYKKVK